MKWDDLQREHGYNSWLAYGQSKLANLLFCFELARRCDRRRAPASSAPRPTPATRATNLQFAGPRGWEAAAMRLTNVLFAQSAEMGALPSLYAATAAGVCRRRLHRPRRAGGSARISARRIGLRTCDDVESQRRLWEVSEELTGVHYDFAGRPA